MVKAESIRNNTSNNWGTHVHCDLLFQPSICEPTLLFHLATTKEVQLSRQYGNPPVLPGTWRQYVSPVPLRSTLASQCLPDERKNSNFHLWDMLLLFLIYLLQAPGLDHHRPPVARHGEHFEAELAKKINLKFHTRPLSRTEPPLPVNVRGRVWKAGIDEGEESDAAAHLVS